MFLTSFFTDWQFFTRRREDTTSSRRLHVKSTLHGERDHDKTGCSENKVFVPVAPLHVAKKAQRHHRSTFEHDPQEDRRPGENSRDSWNPADILKVGCVEDPQGVVPLKRRAIRVEEKDDEDGGGGSSTKTVGQRSVHQLQRSYEVQRCFTHNACVFEMTSDVEGLDPFRIFTVDMKEPCRVLNVSIRQGESRLAKGWVTGDPEFILVLRVPGTPNGRKRIRISTDGASTSSSTNSSTSESLNFVLIPQIDDQNNTTALGSEANKLVLEAHLSMWKYVTGERHVGTQEVDLSDLLFSDHEKEVTLTFGEVAVVALAMKVVIDKESDLRFGQNLGSEEMDYLAKRRSIIGKQLVNLLGNSVLYEQESPPVIGLLGSGGGFRAMTGLSGAFKALFNSGLLDCLTYVAGLSGSSWYLSTLYSHPDFLPKSPEELEVEIKVNISHSPFWLLAPHSLYRYIGSIRAKNNDGQPVSFTDFFGHLLGDTLLKGRADVKLSDQRAKIANGQLPLPLYACVHVKENVSAQVFQEWIEFSPYEVGVVKYGTFMKTEHFGSKFYRGKIVQAHPEYPLHFLQGIWGSAFCILFRRILDERIRLPIPLPSTSSEDNECQVERIPHHHHDILAQEEETFRAHDNLAQEEETFRAQSDTVLNVVENQNRSDKTAKSSDSDDEDEGIQRDTTSLLRSRNSPKQSDGRLTLGNGLWQRFVDGIWSSPFFDTRRGRAGLVLNPLRGLSYVPLFRSSPPPPTIPDDDQPFKGLREVGPLNSKTLYVVDGGLTFNLPFSLLLRPQREVDLLLAFDFSARDKDLGPPFKELLFVEEWAKLNNCPFPPVRECVAELKNKPIQECYVFKHPEDLFCPIILYFPLVNKHFRKYKAPGVLRQTSEELSFADFEIFSDPNTPYSLFNFKYTHLQFDRLNKLMEFNVLNNLDVIKATIIEAIERRRKRTGTISMLLSGAKRIVKRLGDLNMESCLPQVHR